ncbi:MAG: glycosyltransferase family 2 protein, partial [Chlamydiae bacterium]|nr:glycosyltransferase family 2 protein [Chlamydiota bacterium]
EDMEMAIKYKKYRYLHHQNPQVGFIPEPACWTEVPERWKILGRQRTRWQMGIMQVLWKYRSMLFNPRYGVAGLVSYPYFFFGEMLSPLFEMIGYITIILAIIFGISSLKFSLFFFSITIGLGTLFTIASCLIEIWLFKKYNTFDHLWKMILYSFMENIGYRQVHLWWRFRAFFKIFTTHSAAVKDMEKKGFTGSSREGLRKES